MFHLPELSTSVFYGWIMHLLLPITWNQKHNFLKTDLTYCVPHKHSMREMWECHATLTSVFACLLLWYTPDCTILDHKIPSTCSPLFSLFRYLIRLSFSFFLIYLFFFLYFSSSLSFHPNIAIAFYGPPPTVSTTPLYFNRPYQSFKSFLFHPFFFCLCFINFFL